jgi:type I restriction-modification system DNA methylase subunit
MALKKRTKPGQNEKSAVTVGYEAELWKMAVTLRGNMDAAEYKHVVLGLIFLKYTDAFEEQHKKPEADRSQGADPEDRDEYCTASISIYGQESNYTTWRLAKMNLAIRGVEGRIEQGDSFPNDRFPDLKADFILANLPFNVSEWGGERLRDDKRWKDRVRPAGNANFAWAQHFIHHHVPSSPGLWRRMITQ